MKSYKLKIIIFLGIISTVFLLPKISWAVTYYVRTDGNDSCNGLYDQAGSSGNCAKLTVNGAATLTNAGDTVYIRDGTYSGTVSISRSGSLGSPITYTGTTSAWISNKVDISASYIIVDGLRLGNVNDPVDYNNAAMYESIAFTSSGANNIVRNCLIDPGATIDGPYGGAIRVEGSNSYITITGNIFSHINYCKGVVYFGTNSSYVTVSNNTFATTWDVDVFYIWGTYHTISGNNISGNVIHNSSDQHSDVFQTYAYGYVSNNHIIENNYIHDTQCQLGFITREEGGDVTGVHSWTFRNNIFANVSDVLRLSIPTSKLYNNLFYNVGTAYAIEIGGAPPSFNSTDLEIFNNAFIGNQAAWQQNYGGNQPYTHDYNFFANADFSAKNLALIIIGNSNPPYDTIPESHPKNGGNPQFVNSAGGNFHIGAKSVLKDVGITIASFSTDKDGVARPQGSAWDIGAYEYVGTADTTPPAAPSGITIN